MLSFPDLYPEGSMGLKEDFRDADDRLTSMQRSMAVQELSAMHGIKLNKRYLKTIQTSKSPSTNTVKVFGVRLESLPVYDTDYGSVPRFVVDACSMLLEHADKEGLFRKAGSIARRNALRVKLDAGEECLTTADPHDVAGLVKEFFRQLPEPVLPTKLHDSFLTAQQLNNGVNRTDATLLLSCILPGRNRSVLRYFFDFLNTVSKRSEKNRMDSSNLSVVLTPNLLPSGEGTKKMDTTKRLKLQTAVIQCCIEHTQDFGVLPRFMWEKDWAAMLASETSALLPPHREERTRGQRLATWIKNRILCCGSHQESTSGFSATED